MAGAKRWLSGFLAGLILFSWTAALGEENSRNTVEIQESLVSRESEGEKTLEDHLLLLWQLMQTKEVRNLLQIEDVKTIATEIVLKVLIWMAENRPVTMKILAELGIGEPDLRCVGKIWDSAERIQAAAERYMSSEDGNSLAAEYVALKEDPEFREALNRFLTMISSEDIRSLSDTLFAPEAPGTEAAPGKGPLTQEALDQQLDEDSFLGSLFLKMLQVLEQSEWVAEALPPLLENENLWNFLRHLADRSTELNLAIMDEYNQLTADPEVEAFTKRTLSAFAVLAERFNSADTENPDSGETPDEAAKEAAP